MAEEVEQNTPLPFFSEPVICDRPLTGFHPLEDV